MLVMGIKDLLVTIKQAHYEHIYSANIKGRNNLRLGWMNEIAGWYAIR